MSEVKIAVIPVFPGTFRIVLEFGKIQFYTALYEDGIEAERDRAELEAKLKDSKGGE